MSQRLTRKEIKRDEVLETVGSVIDFTREHARSLLLGVVALVVAALAAAGALAWMRHQEVEAQELLARALQVLEAPIDAEGARPEDRNRPSFASEAARAARTEELLQEVVESFARTEAAEIAGVYLGFQAARGGDLDLARDHWERFLKRSGDHLLGAEVRLNLMALDRAQGRGAELATELRGMLESAEAPLPQEVILQQLAITLEELGRLAEAREVYSRLAEEHPLSPYQEWARGRSEALGGVAASTRGS